MNQAQQLQMCWKMILSTYRITKQIMETAIQNPTQEQASFTTPTNIQRALVRTLGREMHYDPRIVPCFSTDECLRRIKGISPEFSVTIRENSLMGQNLAKYLLRYLKRLRAIERKKVAITKLENAVSFYANSGMDPKNRQRRFLTIRFLIQYGKSQDANWDFWLDRASGFVSHMNYLARPYLPASEKYFQQVEWYYWKVILPSQEQSNNDESSQALRSQTQQRTSQRTQPNSRRQSTSYCSSDSDASYSKTENRSHPGQLVTSGRVRPTQFENIASNLNSSSGFSSKTHSSGPTSATSRVLTSGNSESRECIDNYRKKNKRRIESDSDDSDLLCYF
ncbi:hypothetical protein BKA69DRAFT_869320 [Paraphysoderma sedebokerense]|nr:hypothetical protein BKA69DRAFT_869320 [Paraphysoderma sedebokerense]